LPNSLQHPHAVRSIASQRFEEVTRAEVGDKTIPAAIRRVMVRL